MCGIHKAIFVVGYQNKAIAESGWNLMGPTFAPVSGAKMTLADIKANDNFSFGNDTLQTLKGNGSTLGLYTYASEAVAEELGIEPGWYDYDGIQEDEAILCNSVELPYGSTAILQAGSSDAALVFAGAVADKDFELTIAAGGWNLRANCMPVDYTLADLDANEEFSFGNDTLQTLKTNGSTLGLYTYASEVVAEELGIEVGWYDYDGIQEDEAILCNDVAIPSGYGFILQAGSDKATVIVPTPLVK